MRQMELYPLKFEEIYKKYLWGGKGFDRLGKTAPDDFAAESWEIACHKDGMSIVANGPLKGTSLKDLVASYKRELLGSRGVMSNDEFPLLVKFINATDKLSVQVHPNDQYALKHEGEFGKNEAWAVLEAGKDAELIIGVKGETDKAQLKKAIKENVIEDVLARINVQVGDVINIPAGTLHAIGKGIMLAEIQQNSNTTYRLFDYNRTDSNGEKRALNIEKAFDMINFSAKRSRGKSIGVRVKVGDKSEKFIYIANKNFCVETFTIDGETAQYTNGTTFYIYVFTNGNGSIKYKDKTIDVQKGDTYLMPANMGHYRICGNLNFIRTYVPSIDEDIVRPLMELGLSREDIYSKIDGVREYEEQN